MSIKEIGLEINNEQTKCRFMPLKSIEKVTKLIYLGKTPTNQNCTQKTIRAD
jgi:hypothetical protein